MVTNTYPKKPIPLGGGTYAEDDFSLNLGRFIVARLFELKNKQK